MNKIKPGYMVVQPETEEYTADDLDKLLAKLETTDANTLRAVISAYEHIELDDTGKLPHFDMRLSPLAFKQICSFVAKGLWPLVADVGGISATGRSFEDAISVPIAVRIMNQCIRLRFAAYDGICGRNMIQNHLTRVVDGVVGPRYRYLANHQLVSIALDLLRGNAVPMAFHSATLIGRRMSIVFLASDPIGTMATGEPMYGGCYFSNSEAGECGVHGAMLVQIGDQPLRCLSKIQHIAHAGKTFNKRLGSMLVGVTESWDTLKRVTSSTAHLEESLAFLDEDGKVDKEYRRKMEAKLTKHLDRRLATDIIRRAIFVGSSDTFVPRSVTRAEIASRCVRDIFVSLMRAAQDQYPDVRENIERTAFDVLARKIHF